MPNFLLNLVITLFKGRQSLYHSVASFSGSNMKTILGIIFFLASYLPVFAQVTVLADNPDDGCRIKFEKIKQKIADRRKKYEFNVHEYRIGLFCSECWRTKSEIEGRARLNFEEHIKQGATHNRRALVAAPEIYDRLYTEYLTDFNHLKEEYDDQYNDCGGDGSSVILQTITDQQLQDYTGKLNGYVSTSNAYWDVTTVFTAYDFYYAWIMRNSIVKWQTIRITESSYYSTRFNNTGNAISGAGNEIKSYIQRLSTITAGGFPKPGIWSVQQKVDVFAIK
jgi:hypothetical protein